MISEHHPAEVRHSPRTPPASAGAWLCFTIRTSANVAPPCSPNHFCFPGRRVAGGSPRRLRSAESGFPHSSLTAAFLLCHGWEEGLAETKGWQILLSHQLLPQPPSGWWWSVKGQLSWQAGGSKTSRKGQQPPMYHIVCKLCPVHLKTDLSIGLSCCLLSPDPQFQ